MGWLCFRKFTISEKEWSSSKMIGTWDHFTVTMQMRKELRNNDHNMSFIELRGCFSSFIVAVKVSFFLSIMWKKFYLFFRVNRSLKVFLLLDVLLYLFLYEFLVKDDRDSYFLYLSEFKPQNSYFFIFFLLDWGLIVLFIIFNDGLSIMTSSSIGW